tara:strand:- start:289 stop:393 length:105 start_codon:yes stop_codon:yes gene_type:complete
MMRANNNVKRDFVVFVFPFFGGKKECRFKEAKVT